MKTFTLLAIFTVLILEACTNRGVPLQNKYQDTPVKARFSTSFENVWESIIDFIASTGQDVQMIDKESGLILSDIQIAHGRDMTNEDNKGQLINPEALIAVSRYTNDFPKRELPFYTASAKWTIRVKSLDSNQTVVHVLVHVREITSGMVKYSGASTGQHEKWILDEISQRLER